jgi:glycine cleavage system H protein
MLALQGPRSQEILQPLVEGADLAKLGYYKFTFARVCGLPDVRISRTGYTGEDGFEVYLPAEDGERVWNALLESGRPHGMKPIGLGARDVLRLEAGMPLYGHEIDLGPRPDRGRARLRHLVPRGEGRLDRARGAAALAARPAPAAGRPDDRRAARPAPGQQALRGRRGGRRGVLGRTVADARHQHRERLRAQGPRRGRAHARDRLQGQAAGLRPAGIALLFAHTQVSTPRSPTEPAALRRTSRMRPDDRKYSASHEWVKPDGDTLLFGITDFAVQELCNGNDSDLVYCDLPEPGRALAAGETFGEIESVKAVSDLNAPVAGEVVESNVAIEEHLEILARDPWEKGWMIRVKPASRSLEGLMDAAAYESYLKQSKH